MEINIEKIGGKNKVTFTHNNRTFVLDYEYSEKLSKHLAKSLSETFEDFKSEGSKKQTNDSGLNLCSVINCPECGSIDVIQNEFNDRCLCNKCGNHFRGCL